MTLNHSKTSLSGALCAAFLLVVGLFGQVATGSGHRLWALLFFVISLGSWGVIVRSAVRGQIKGKSIVFLLLVSLTVVVAFPPATSKDVNSYSLYGRMVSEYHESPYSHTPQSFAVDPWYGRTSYFWTDSASVYGPLFTAVSTGVMTIADTSFTTARLGFQLVDVGALLLGMAVARRRIGGVMAVALIGLNPLILTFGVNDAHCDVLVGVAVLVAATFLQRRQLVFAGAALASAALIKIAVLPALVGGAIWLWCQNERRKVVPFLGSFFAVFVIGLLAGGGLEVLSPLTQAVSRHTRFSIWNPVADLIGSDHIVALSADLLVALVGMGLIIKYRRANMLPRTTHGVMKTVTAPVYVAESSPFLVIAGGLVAYQLCGAYVLSWYAIWSLPLLALVWRNPLALIAMAHGCWVAIAYFSGYGAIASIAVFLSWVAFRYGHGLRVFPWMVDRSILAEP